MEGSPLEPKLAAELERWTARSKATFSLDRDNSPHGSAAEVPVGPRGPEGAELWLSAFLAEAARHARRLARGAALPEDVLKDLRSKGKKTPKGLLRRW